MERITVGVDGSSHSAAALRWAVDEARMRDAELDIVHVWHEPYAFADLPYTSEEMAAFEGEATATLDATVAAAGVDATIESQVFRHPTKGRPVPVLVNAARHSSLLVVGSRGRTAIGAVVLGSVSVQCAHHAPAPLAVVREGAPSPNDGRDIVVGVDGSEGSARALTWAMNEAAVRDAPLVVVHGWYTPYPVPPEGVALVPRDPASFLSRTHALLDGMVSHALTTVAVEPRKIEVEAIEAMAPHALIDRSKDAGALVVGSRGRGGFAGLLLGSVTHQCLHHARTTVVVVPPPRANDSGGHGR